MIEPTEEPVVEPTEEPVIEPTEEPVVEPTEEPAAEEPTEVLEEEIIEINVRLDADGLSEIILTVPSETEATVLAVDGDWVQVDVAGVIGYIFLDDALLMENLIDMPEIEEPEIDEEDPTKNFKVTIFTSRRSVMTPGETVYLTSKIEGFEAFETKLQWAVDKGNGFEEIPGANADSYSFEASVETLAYDWMLTVYYRKPVTE